MKRSCEKNLIEINQLKSKISELNEEGDYLKEVLHKAQKALEKNESEILEQKTKLSKETSSMEIEKFLSNELMKIRVELTEISARHDEKTILSERLAEEIKYFKADLQKSRDMCERLQDELAKVNQDYDDDTFENVMRNELTLMREAYEKRLKDARDENSNLKKKQINEVKKLKDEIKQCEHSKTYLEIQLKSIKNL